MLHFIVEVLELNDDPVDSDTLVGSLGSCEVAVF